MNVTSRSRQQRFAGKPRRVWSLVRKETQQIIRDPSSIAVGVVLPVILILVFGYGLSLDVTDVPAAVVLEDPSPEAVELAAGFQLSPYFKARLFTSMARARELMLARQVDAIVRIRPDFARHLSQGDAEVQVLVHGTDANKARIIQVYAQGAVGQWSARRAAEGKDVAGGPVNVRDRIWFNEANDSHYVLVPGLVVLVMTLIGALLTAMVMAREWERGTLESLFVTPVQNDQAGDEEIVAVIGLVEPEPVAYDDRPAGHVLAFGRPPRRPLPDRPLGVDLDDPGLVGVGPVDEDLSLGVAEAQAPREVGADTDDPVHLPGEHQLPCPRHRGEEPRLEVRRELEAGGQFHGVGRGVFQDDGHRHIHHLQR